MQYTLVELLNQYKVVVPQIQRDYAQGRKTEKDLRKGFISKIKASLEPNAEPLNLDFVYGYTENQSENESLFIPLDGQQRLTTLWLLHWYLAPRNFTMGNDEDVSSFTDSTLKILKSFTYETRVSSKRFCRSLVQNPIIFSVTDNQIKEKIKDAPWFMASWNSDPTIQSMLNMLDTIHESRFDKEQAWNYLTSERRITFDYIDIKSDEFKLTDELYIKMNSRGKPLTSFENFKAQFSSLLSSKETDFKHETIVYQNAKVSYQQYFAFKVDSVWMDLFWSYKKSLTTSLDQGFLNFIFYIAEVLYYKNNNFVYPKGFERNDSFLNFIFSKKKNIDFLFQSLDFLASLKSGPEFFSKLFTSLSLFDTHTTDLFLRSINNSGFEVKDKTLFYAVLSFCFKTNTEIPDESLKDFARIIRNLLLAVRQPNQYKRIEFTSNLRLTNLNEYSKFIDSFIDLLKPNQQNVIYKILLESELSGFSKENISTEKTKATILTSQPKLKSIIFSLEENPVIQGNTVAFKLNTANLDQHIKAFNEIWSGEFNSSLTIRAFLAIGNYSVNTHKHSSLGPIWYFGSGKNWNRILTATDKTERNNVADKLDLLLSSYIKASGTNTNERLQNIIDDFKNEERNWRYYFIKYKSITANPYRDLNLFAWKDDEGFEINSLGNSGNLPLHSYHLNPYLIVLDRLIKDKRVNLYFGRFTEISYLSIDDEIYFYSIKEGWKITCEANHKIYNKLINKYNVKMQDDTFILGDSETKDRIKIAAEFIQEYLNI